MKGINRLFFGIAAAITVLIMFLAKSLLTEEVEPRTYQVSIVVNDSSSSRWSGFQAGIKQAADEKHVRLNFVTTDLANSSAKQKRLVEKEIDTEVDGLILQLYKSEDSEEILKMAEGKSVIELLDCDLSRVYRSYNFAGSVGIDEKKAGQKLAQDVLKAGAKNILLLTGNSRMDSMQNIRSAFEETYEKGSAHIKGELEYTKSLSDNIESFAGKEDIDAIVALDDASMEIAADYVSSMGGEISLFGIGCSEKNLYYLDKGTINSMIVPNEYMIGYKSMVKLINKMENIRTAGTWTEVDFVTVSRGNMYNEDIQKILFPIVQ